MSGDEIAEVQAGGYTAALLWHTSGAFTDAVSQGARDAFAELGIEVVAETNADFDAAQQANDVETVMALDPDIIISLAIGPDAGAEAFRPAVDAGVQLVFSVQRAPGLRPRPGLRGHRHRRSGRNGHHRG